MKKMSKSDKDFYQGYAVAIAQMIRLHGMSQMAKDLCQCAGVNLTDFEKAECDEQDMEVLRECLK